MFQYSLYFIFYKMPRRTYQVKHKKRKWIQLFVLANYSGLVCLWNSDVFLTYWTSKRRPFGREPRWICRIFPESVQTNSIHPKDVRHGSSFVVLARRTGTTLSCGFQMLLRFRMPGVAVFRALCSVPSRLAKSAVILAARYPGHPFNSSVISPRVIREFRRISINKKW